VLYQQALSAALGELQDLNLQIDHFRTQLDRLERQRAAVESICEAIGQWVETREPDTEEEIHFDSPVALTEEEVSLIAYPSRMPNEA
jgi:prefoldin subunit 5